MITLVFDRAAVIRLLREQKKLGQHELGFNKDTLRKIEKRITKHPDDATLATIASKLETSLEEIDDTVRVLNGFVRSTRVAVSACSDPDHARLQRMLDEVLHSDAVYRIGETEIPVRSGLTINVMAHHAAIAPGAGPERKKFSVLDTDELFRPGAGIDREEPVKKRRRK